MKHTCIAVTVLVTALLLAPLLVDAYPILWAQEDNQTCDAHPTTAEGEHAAPVPDKSTKFVVKGAKGAATQACPGETYSVTITFPEERLFLATVSVGTISTNAQCPSRHVQPKTDRVATATLSWKVPCAAKGANAALKVTSAKGSAGGFQDASATLPLSAACAAATCGAAAKPATAAPAAPAAAVKPAVAAKPAAPAAAAAAPAATKAAAPASRAAAAAGCGQSALNYTCLKTTKKGTNIHYSMGPTPPDNACTRGAATTAAPVIGTGGGLMHFAYEGPDAGYAALGFSANPGKMYPSDVVLGWVNPDGTAKVGSYAVHAYDITPSDQSSGWATNMGVVKQGGKTIVCFTRAMEAPGAKAVPKLTAAGAPLIWASSDVNTLEIHNLWGAEVADLTPLLGAGVAAGVPQLVMADPEAAEARNRAVRVAHGALMLLSFALLMPLGVLLSRHKWLFGDDSEGKIRPGWYKLHIGVQISAVLLSVVGTILIFSHFGRGREAVSVLYSPHMGLGLAAVCAGVVQGLIGHNRPGITHAKRGAWRSLHYGWGWMVMLAGIASCGIGIALIHKLQGDKVAYWVAPTAAVLGLMMLAGIALETRRAQLMRAGGYSPKDHSFGPGASKAAAAKGLAGEDGNGAGVPA